MPFRRFAIVPVCQTGLVSFVIFHTFFGISSRSTNVEIIIWRMADFAKFNFPTRSKAVVLLNLIQMLYPDIAHELIERRRHDLAVRQRLITEGTLFRGYNPEMEAVHLDNARRLQEILDQIGWPAQKQVGDEASQAAWLIVQHAISLPAFMKSALALMNEQQQARRIDPVNLAFLSDRIAMYENRPQSYGTQFVSDEQGRLVAYELDESIDQVNQRRQTLGLNTVEERLAELIARMNVEQEKQPTASERQLQQEEYDAWRRKVGWFSI